MRSHLLHNRSGQSLLETALLLPIMLTIVFNAVNIGYFFFVALNLATAPRQGVQYSIQGPQSYQQTPLPSASSVSSLVYEDITGAIPSAASTPMRVCTVWSLQQNPPQSFCQSFGTGTGVFAAPDTDPEAPYLVLNRVDIQYTVTALISGAIFNIVLPPSLTFHRMVEMRAME
jgi:Flp pilus assembly protein TadG